MHYRELFHVKQFTKQMHYSFLPRIYYIMSIALHYYELGSLNMWKPLITAFILVFVAELGDKTQLSTMMLASKSDSIWLVFIGSSCALVLSSLCGVLLGSVINKYIPTLYIQIGSGVVFLIVGFLLISGKL